MFTKVKTPSEIESMRTGGKMLATVLDLMRKNTAPGITPKELATQAAKELKALGGKPAFLNYQGFPAVICVSLNAQVVHGIPSSVELVEGDLISFDFGVAYQGMITDSAITVPVGVIDTESARLLEVTKASLYAGLDTVISGVMTGDIGQAIEKVLSENNLGIVRDLVGHGVGHQVHEDPNIPNYGRKGTGAILKAGMTVAIEPMATLGFGGIFVADDGWTVSTSDGSLSAHFEHTILVTETGHEILTKM